jgi:hypothetical protein
MNNYTQIIPAVPAPVAGVYTDDDLHKARGLSQVDPLSLQDVTNSREELECRKRLHVNNPLGITANEVSAAEVRHLKVMEQNLGDAAPAWFAGAMANALAPLENALAQLENALAAGQSQNNSRILNSRSKSTDPLVPLVNNLNIVMPEFPLTASNILGLPANVGLGIIGVPAMTAVPIDSWLAAYDLPNGPASGSLEQRRRLLCKFIGIDHLN